MKPGQPQERVPLLAGDKPPHGEHESSHALFNDGPRRRQDTGWMVGYLLSVLSVVAWGVALIFSGSPDFFDQISPDHMNDPNSCPSGPPAALRRRGLMSDPDVPAAANLAALLSHPVSAVSCTLAGSGFLGFLFILGFRHRADFMIKLALGLQVAVPAALGVVAAVMGNLFLAGGLVLYCALLVWLYYMWREQIGLVGRLLGVAGKALVDNPGLLGLGLAMPVVLGIVLMPAMVFSTVAVSNGHVVPNSDRVGVHKSDQGVLQCVDQDGDVVLCCSWQVDTQAQVYLGLLGVVVTWTTFLMGQIKLFAVSGAVAQWYFTPVAPSLTTPRRSRVLFSLRHALGPSFGSLCAASALLTVISYLRQALDVAEQQSRQENKVVAILFTIMAIILRVILSLVEFLTRFTTVRMAITGERFVDAAHGVVDLLKRNAMDAFGVWWLPPFILGNCMLVLSVVFGALVWGCSSLVYHAGPGDGSTVVLGLAAGTLAVVVLSFLKGLLTNVLEAVFVCFAMDRDMARVTRQDVFVVFQEVPGVKGHVIEQPDGGLAYGAPTDAGPARV